ncbi:MULTISPECIES: nucleoside-diphosphate sugar epimerase/dehydratase [unclassified Bosea (in: a-proteobacteria)]|uniref:nucleoside-diphosphate sugar epimerase/dehydratase n=1 Tax=unclassified Bosea (in: a-proteobacteria) TaxID=2653178 RepID=UPI000954B7A7|nr:MULTISPECIES: nucleoside-diphosphate sugar epimerase/dehydratase [unclassified Bosea (in: a-proteobacteria)]TAJ31229.1 MAG: polysaccharide biosynthesis protein [Bosea sp. (in: a-proteobacteria)]SIQ96011.1 O-antigen biosynthesis protein WbqV [Bosea sp. TND4EK4]
MAVLPKQNLKKLLVILHDLVVTALAIWLVFVIRFEGRLLDEHLRYLPRFLPFFVVYAGLVYWFFSLYRSKWRFASLPDLSNIVKAVSVLTISLLAIDYVLVSPELYGNFYFGKISIALYWLVQIALLGGPRLAYRYFKYARSRNQAERGAALPALLLGRSVEVEMVIRAMEAGTMRRLRPAGILSPRADDLGQSIRGVPVLGLLSDIERVAGEAAIRGEDYRRIVATPSALLPEAQPDKWLKQTRKLALPISRIESPGEGTRDTDVAPLEIEDLLVRSTVTIDRQRLGSFLKGKRVIVTGGGGSIGSEICLRCAAFGASEILVVESSEPALFQITEQLSVVADGTVVSGALADVRDRDRIMPLFAGFRPDIVIHAAALKHVPYLEADWSEGIKTNIFGSVNVTDAAVAAGARTFVLISTDKAIEPVSMLGATKRFAEIYAQSRDAEFVGSASAMRLVAVRFGNVLGSAGSVVPKFKAQIARGGPITVTSPEMIRYFMTIREACDLVLTAASHTQTLGPDAERAAVYVLKMGQPVKIMDLAERMIRLAGYEPGEDIEIVVTGVRPGERLNEILFARDEPMAETGLDGVMAAKPSFADRPRIQSWLSRLEVALHRGDRAAADVVLVEAIPDFSRREQTPPDAPAQLRSPPAVASLR